MAIIGRGRGTQVPRWLTLATPFVLVACGQGTDAVPSPQAGGTTTSAPTNATLDAPKTGVAAGWSLAKGAESASLVYPGSGAAEFRLSCSAREKRITVDVPAFRAVGSEERLTFGSGGDAHALVVDPRASGRLGGVSGMGEAPANLLKLIGGPLSVTYGAQTSGAHPAPPHGLAREFASACVGTPAGPIPAPPTAASAQASPCLIQNGKRLAVAPLRAVGTEPFWGAKIEGRCVTYSHPDDQPGTRVWTRFAANGPGGSWTGALGGRPFVLRTSVQAGCSDGMSDRRYPLAVKLTVGGELRSGCAEPADRGRDALANRLLSALATTPGPGE